MSTLAAQLTELVGKAAAAAGHADAPVPLEPCAPCNNPAHGDYQSNYAFRLGKALRTNPRAVAQAVADALPESDLIASVEVAGPGFLNFRLTDAALGADVLARTLDDRLGLDKAEGTLVIDYSSPNIAKRMHVGHLRSTIIGNALHRLFDYLGYEVVADNHIGDWGTQFGKLIVAWHRWRDEEAFAADAIAELQRIYQLFGTKKDEEPELADLAREETAKLQAGDPENIALWQRFVEASLVEFQGVYDRLGIDFTVTHGESFYRDELQGLVQRLLEEGVATDSEGAVVVPFTAEDGKGLAKQPLLIRKSDGAALYGTTDLATIEHREQTWHPERAIYVTDVRQQLHFRQVFAAARKMGAKMELVHVWFGMLRFADGAVASTRAGSVINLVDLLDAARDKAREVVDQLSPDLPEAERAVIAEAVGTGAVRYADLSQNPQSDFVFEWDKVLSLEGNTAPYMMYAYARVQSLFRRAGIDTASFVPTAPVVTHPVERELMLSIARTPEVIEQAAAAYRPNLLCEHLYALASSFSRFWAECPVLADDVPEPVRASRLSLAAATANAMGTGLQLLGIEPLSRM